MDLSQFSPKVLQASLRSAHMIWIKILGINTGEPTSFDGKWLKSYDPSSEGVSHDGRRMIAHIEVTDDLLEAIRFEDFKAAIAYSRRSDGIRADGKPNRPLTAFDLEYINYEEVVQK